MVAATLELAKNAIDAALTLVPILLGDARTVDRADLELDLGKRHLIEHQATACVELLANDERGFDFHTVFVNDLARKKRIIARVARGVFGDDDIPRNAVFGEHVNKEFAFRAVLSCVNVRLVGNAGSNIPLHAHLSRGDNPFGIPLEVEPRGIFGLLGVHTAGQKDSICHRRRITYKYVI